MVRLARRNALSLLLGAAILPSAAALPATSACRQADVSEPRTLVLALDGVPFRAIQAARAQGAFRGWPDTTPLISSFPSLTNLAFTQLFRPFDVDPAGGYEVRHFDWEQNRVVGGSLRGYADRLFAWRDTFDVTGRTARGKLLVYTRPRKHSRKQLRQAMQAMLKSERDLVLAHVGATDALLHLRGDRAIASFLMEVDRAMIELRKRHLTERQRPLRVVLLSDHGNTRQKVRRVKGIRRSLRRAGLRPVTRLKRPGDVVARTFGVISFGALYVERADAGKAARAIAALPGIDLAAWPAGEGEIRVVAAHGEAVIRWHVRVGTLRFAYEMEDGDPLRYADLVIGLRDAGALDPDGFADAPIWFAASRERYFPDALRRVTQGLSSDHLVNPATVLFSTSPGYSWGLKSAHLSSRLAGGRLEATHGGLDRESSLAFFLTDDVDLNTAPALDLESALAAFTDLGRCVHQENTRAVVAAD